MTREFCVPSMAFSRKAALKISQKSLMLAATIPFTSPQSVGDVASDDKALAIPEQSLGEVVEVVVKTTKTEQSSANSDKNADKNEEVVDEQQATVPSQRDRMLESMRGYFNGFKGSAPMNYEYLADLARLGAITQEIEKLQEAESKFRFIGGMRESFDADEDTKATTVEVATLVAEQKEVNEDTQQALRDGWAKQLKDQLPEVLAPESTDADFKQAMIELLQLQRMAALRRNRSDLAASIHDRWGTTIIHKQRQIGAAVANAADALPALHQQAELALLMIEEMREEFGADLGVPERSAMESLFGGLNFDAEDSVEAISDSAPAATNVTVGEPAAVSEAPVVA